MAKAAGISPSSVRRIWTGQGLQPHRVRAFKISNDPKFADKLKDVVGLYVDPPAHAVVLSLDEKSQIQSLPLARTGALDRTQPGLPMKKGRCATMTHDYKRHGTTTLFAALDVLEGKVIGRCMHLAAAYPVLEQRGELLSSRLITPSRQRKVRATRRSRRSSRRIVPATEAAAHRAYR